MSEPIAGANIWRPVMERAGYQCECLGACGRKHAPERCGVFHSDATRLTAASYPGLVGIWAQCADCYDRRLKLINARKIDIPQEGLF